MKTIKLNIDVQTDCNCTACHDTLFSKTSSTVKEAMEEVDELFADYHSDIIDCAVSQSAKLIVENEEECKEYSILTKEYDVNKKKWNDTERFNIELGTPDQIYAI